VEQQPIWGANYRLERGKGYGEARWWVLSRDGRTEVAGGLLYEDAKRIFDTSERTANKPVAKPRATLNPKIIDFEEESRAEMRTRRRGKWQWISPR